MSYVLYDYVSPNGTNEILLWAQSLQRVELAKLNAKLDMLEKHGPGCRPEVLTGTDVAGIQKMRIKGNVQLRPLLCEGPINVMREFTFLAGAKEVGGKLKPNGVLAVAQKRKIEVAGDAGGRRVVHVRPQKHPS